MMEDDLRNLLREYKIGHCEDQLKRLGVHGLEDLRSVAEEDLEGVGFGKIQKRAFFNMRDNERIETHWCKNRSAVDPLSPVAPTAQPYTSKRAEAPTTRKVPLTPGSGPQHTDLSLSPVDAKMLTAGFVSEPRDATHRRLQQRLRVKTAHQNTAPSDAISGQVGKLNRRQRQHRAAARRASEGQSAEHDGACGDSTFNAETDGSMLRSDVIPETSREDPLFAVSYSCKGQREEPSSYGVCNDRWVEPPCAQDLASPNASGHRDLAEPCAPLAQKLEDSCRQLEEDFQVSSNPAITRKMT